MFRSVISRYEHCGDVWNALARGAPFPWTFTGAVVVGSFSVSINPIAPGVVLAREREGEFQQTARFPALATRRQYHLGQGCRIHRASPDPEADRITCQLATERFRFKPATDAAGNPVVSTFGWQQRWFRLFGDGRLATGLLRAGA